MYYKLLRVDKEYKEGINEDTDYSFIDGIIFDDEKSIIKNFFYTDRIAEVLVPDGENISIHHNDRFIAKKVILKSIKYLWDIDTIEYLLDCGIDVMCEESELLSEAARSNKFEIVKYIIEKGNYTQEQIDTAFCKAVYNNYMEISKYLLENGANINKDTLVHRYLLRYSIRDRHFEMTHFLVENGFNIEAGDIKPIVEASKAGYLDIVAYLIKNNANIHVDDEMALISAIKYRHKDIVTLLIENGANVNVLKEFPFSGDFSFFFSLPLIWMSGISRELKKSGIKLCTYFARSVKEHFNAKMFLFQNLYLMLVLGLFLLNSNVFVERKVGVILVSFPLFINLMRTFLSLHSENPEYFNYYFFKSVAYVCLCINFLQQNLFCNIIFTASIFIYLAYYITEFSYINS